MRFDASVIRQREREREREREITYTAELIC